MSALQRAESMIERASRVFLAVMTMLLAAVVAAVLPARVIGADDIPILDALKIMAALIFLAALVLRGLVGLDFLDFLAALLVATLMTLILIAWVNGDPWTDLFDSFNLRWLGHLSVYIVSPWVAGFIAGSGIRWLRNRRSSDSTPEGATR